jgi:peptidyl-prolyl cis-trans isomerase D
MLQAIRDKTSGWIAGIIVFLLILAMAAYALPSFFGSSFTSAVAEVGGEEIGLNEWNDTLGRARQNMAQRMGDAFDPSMIDDPIFKRQTLDQLIDQELLRQDAEAAGVGFSANRLREQIRTYQAFQVAGQFSPEQYLLVLQSNQLTVDRFERDITEGAQANEVRAALAQSALVSDPEIDAYLRLRDQQRSFRFLRMPLADIEAPAPPDEAAVRKYYDERTADFMTDEQLDLEYVEINLADQSVSEPTDAEVAARYEEIKRSFQQPEQRLVSHILIELAEDADEAAQQAALAKAEDLAKRARAGEKFDELARKNSQDIGSAEQGGDLGWMLRNTSDTASADEVAFETPLFALAEAGAISDPVRTSQGYHVIQLREIQAERVKTLDEVKAELAQQMVQDRRMELYSDVVAALTNELLRDPFQLQGAADAAKLELKRTGLFARFAPIGIAALPVVQRELGNSAVLDRGQVSSVLRPSTTQTLVIRVAERRKSEPKPFEEVAEAARTALQQRNHEQALKARANEWLLRVRKDGSLDALLTETSKTAESAEAVLRSAANVPQQVLLEAFKLKRPADQAKEFGLAELSPQEWALIELASVVEGDPSKLDTAARDAVREQLKSERAFAETQAYLESLRKSTDITVYEERL